MSLKRILGTMLVSRMAGRGRRGGGLGGLGGLGTAAMLGGRRGGMGRKMGLAAMGYMAYRAYKDHQGSTAGRGASSASAGGGGLGGMLQGLADQLTGGGAAEPADEDIREPEVAADRMDDDTALLHLRGMIAAAYADGSLDQEERARIMSGIEEAEPTEAERAQMEREIANPKAVDELLAQVRDEETAEQFYLASSAAIDPDTPENGRYLATLRDRLRIPAETAAEIDAMAQ